MREVVVVEAVRSAVGRRNGGFAAMHPADLLGEIVTEVLARSGVDPAEVGQLVGGCVGQVGMQSMNVTRNAWLGSGLPVEVAATMSSVTPIRCVRDRRPPRARPAFGPVFRRPPWTPHHNRRVAPGA